MPRDIDESVGRECGPCARVQRPQARWKNPLAKEGRLRCAVRPGGFFRRRRELEDHFTGPGQAHLFTGNAFDGFGISPEGFDLASEFAIVAVELLDFRARLLDLLLRAAHGQEAVGSEDVMDPNRQQDEAQNHSRMTAPERW